MSNATMISVDMEPDSQHTPRTKVVKTLEPGDGRRDELMSELVRLERRIFPKHESMADTLARELQKRNVTVFYAMEGNPGDSNGNGRANPVAGYAIVSFSSVVASITKLAVRDNCRRQGYGEALVKAAVHKARSRRSQCINLHVDPSRTPALSLYKKLGFETDSVVQSYYATNRDAYRMVLTLDHGI